jgi:hypothetical protein
LDDYLLQFAIFMVVRMPEKAGQLQRVAAAGS